MKPAPFAFPITPTPVARAQWVSEASGREVYIKHEGTTHALYGGNKARKLAALLAEAREAEATDLVSVGAAGSNHLLATAAHGRAAGFAVTAIVVPGPDSPEARDALRATAAQGCALWPVSGEWAAVPRLLGVWRALKRRGRRPYFLPPGGSSVVGALGYVSAVQELAWQHACGELPEWPEAMVCVLGSGGMLAGLAAGVHLVERPCRVVGVAVWSRWAAHRGVLAWLARRTLVRASGARPGPRAFRHLEVELGQLGAGYGHPTEAAREARELFARDGVALELTYTAKAAAGLLALARSASGPRRLLFWHSRSSAPLGPLLADGPPPSARVQALLR